MPEAVPLEGPAWGSSEVRAKLVAEGRWIEDGSYPVVPALPPIREQGARPEDRGFESPDALLAAEVAIGG